MRTREFQRAIEKHTAFQCDCWHNYNHWHFLLKYLGTGKVRIYLCYGSNQLNGLRADTDYYAQSIRSTLHQLSQQMSDSGFTRARK